jgi:class 3 adenylate cyclase
VDIAAWLRELGLERYDPVFRDNEIDWEVLPELTEGDLEKLGLPLGPRKKLRKAIAGLSARTSGVSVQAPSSPTPVSPEAERRQLTVMFADLVGSTALAARLDPEEMRDVIRAYQDAVAGAVARFGGHIAKFMGDGVLCYFGWPTAHEDAAERAVRAALAIVAAVKTLPMAAAERLAARVGIATGLVVVGDLVGTDEARERTVIGETPNLAARLQGLAAPGQVIVAEGTRHLVGGLFELEDLGEHWLKGFGEPVRAHRVIRPGRAVGRFEALHGASLIPMVGREQEIALLLDRWRQAKAGEGQVVLISGEPGIGKSRLVQAFRQELSGERHLALRHFCSPYHTNSALYPVSTALERAAGIAAEDQPAARLTASDHTDTTTKRKIGGTSMLMVGSYAKDYVDACRAQMAAQLASYRKVLAAKPADIDAFERQFFNHMILALDHYCVHRSRGMEGKDGNPLNEVRMLCDAIMEHQGRMSASKTIRYEPEPRS